MNTKVDNQKADEHTEKKMFAPIDAPPKFEPKIPDELMEQWHTLDPVTKILLREQSILRQQTEWIMARCTISCPAVTFMPALQRDVEQIKKFRDVLTAKWSVVAFCFMSFIVPTITLLIGKHLSKLVGP